MVTIYIFFTKPSNAFRRPAIKTKIRKEIKISLHPLVVAAMMTKFGVIATTAPKHLFRRPIFVVKRFGYAYATAAAMAWIYFW